MATDLRELGPVVLFVDGHQKVEFYRRLIDALTLELGADCRPVSPPALLSPTLEADLVVVNDETWPYCGAALPGLRRRSIPTLHLVDGILEWRNTWENPQRETTPGATPLFRPVLADKIACLGRAQARVLETWGNGGKCEIVGSPRFDGVARQRMASPIVNRHRRILIATARTPGFTEEQVQSVKTALLDLKEWLTAASDLEIVWRLAPVLADIAEGENTMEGVSLHEQLQTVDATVTTPSTIQLESMLAGVPTAVIDYANRPPYVGAAWTMTSQKHIGQVMPMLLAPSSERIGQQEFLLHDNLECRTPATPRVVLLVEQMVRVGRRSRAGGVPLSYEHRIIQVASGHEIPEHLDGSIDDTEIGSSDLTELRTEVAHLRRAMNLNLSQRAYRAFCQLEIWLKRRGN